MRASVNTGPSRPLTSYGGMHTPARNIKSICNGLNTSVAGNEANILKQKLHRMTVLGNNAKSASVNNLNNEYIVNNWISDELTKFETKLEK